jgi:hypothetical protein
MNLRSLVVVSFLSLGACPSTTNTPADSGKADVVVDARVNDVGDVRIECSSPNTACGNACVNLLRAHAHCGACGRGCEGWQVCANGQCVIGGVCPARCANNEECRGCVMEGDPTRWCCQIQGMGSRCFENGSRCPGE